MAVVKTFKQQCPSCEAMVTIKEGMVGKKVDCHKCKDKFIAERPDDDEDDVQVKTKKDAKAGGKKTTTLSAKAPPAGRKTKLANQDDDVDEVDDIEDVDDVEDAPQGKSAKDKNAAKAVSKKSASDDDDEDAPAKKAAGAGNKNLTMGLALAGVGVVILVVAAVLLMRGGRTPTPIAKGNDGDGDKKTEVKPSGDGTKKKYDPDPTPKLPDGSALPLDANEIAKLTNLLPNDTEHVFHVYYANLLTGASPLKDAVFQVQGTLDDKVLRKKLGFALQSIDDVIVAEKFTSPGWKYTIIHFNETFKEEDLQEPLNLVPSKTPIEGQSYFTMQPNSHPWFDTLARFQLGIPAALRSFAPPPRAALVRLHNSQTLIVGDEIPVKALLKAKGQFPLQSGVRAAMGTRNVVGLHFVGLSDSDNDQLPPGGGAVGGGGKLPSLDNTIWQGTEGPANEPLRIIVKSGNKVVVESAKGGGEGTVTLAPSPGGLPTITVTCPSSELTYQGTGDLASKSITGMGKKGGEVWNFSVRLIQSDTPEPKVDPKVDPKTDPMPMTPSAEKYATIKESLRKTLDMLEARASEGKDKVLFSSVTDMDANRIETNNPDFANQIVRQPRQFWDVTQILPEQKPRIRNLGTALIMRDTLRYQWVNEVTCAQELDAKEFERELTERGASQVARFIQGVTKHEVRTPRSTETKQPDPMPGAQPPEKPEDKKPIDVGLSQIFINQKANVLEFQIDLTLDNTAMSYIQAIASLASSSIRVEIDWLVMGKGRHTLGQAAKALGEKGLSAQKIEARKYPPGAFPRPENLPRFERYPKNRVSFMAGLLPYLGHQNLFNRIRFEQSWRDPSNWMSGNTIVPQFLDPMYPDSSQYVTFGDLPMDFAATHYVGIAGVGLDAASFKRNDPATVNQRGVLSYDESATLDDVLQGRGISNTIFMIQAPHVTPDGHPGVFPWIAGGGATLRGVPETKSILPFVLTTDKNGKVIHNKNKRGTYAVMTDGSVRFIDQNVSDEVFKAMCTVGGPTPIGFDLNQNPNTPLIPPPEKAPAKKESPTDGKAPPNAEPQKKASLEPNARDADAIVVAANAEPFLFSRSPWASATYVLCGTFSRSPKASG